MLLKGVPGIDGLASDLRWGTFRLAVFGVEVFLLCVKVPLTFFRALAFAFL